MTIHVYKSALCPRCAYAIKSVKKLQEEFNDLEVITYDIATNIRAFKQAGIKMLPTIMINDEKRSWVLPRSAQIRDFILENRCGIQRPASRPV